MLLLSIEFSHFRQYKKEKIYFPQKGLIGVLGNNGAGKSTLFNAIAYAFYGKYDDVTKDMLRNQNSNPKEHCYVIIDFLYQGNFHRIKRDLISSRCFIEVNGKRKAFGTGPLNNFVENDLFKMDYKAFTSCYYATQDGFDALTKLNPRPREEMLLKLLRIDSIDKAATKTRKEKNVLEIEIQEAKRFMKNENELKERKKNLKNEQKDLKKQFESLTKEYNDNKKELSKTTEEKQKSDEFYKTYQSLLTDIDKAKSKVHTLIESSLKPTNQQLDRLLKQKERYEKIKTQKENYYKLTKQKEELSEKREEFLSINRLDKEIESLKKEIEEYENSILQKEKEILAFGELETEYSNFEKNIAKQENSLQEVRDKYQEYQTELALKKQKYNDIQDTKKQFEELGEETPCPTCKRPLGEHYGNEIEHLEKKHKKIIEESKIIKNNQDKFLEKGKKEKELLESKKTELKKISQQLKEKDKLEGTFSTLKQEQEKKKEILTNINKERSKLPKNSSFQPEQYKKISEEIVKILPIYEEILSIEKTIEDIPSFSERIKEIEKEIEQTETIKINLQKELSKLNFNEEKHHSLTNQLESLREQLEELKEKGSLVKTNLKINETNLETVEKEILETKEILKETKEKQSMISDLTKLDNLYKAFKKDILGKLSPTLSEIMTDMIETLTDGKYNQVELDEQYNVFIYREGNRNPLDFYSGGEKKLAALCQRLAISQLLISQTGQASFDMCALDEVFGAMDSQRQDSLIEMFRNLNEMFSQILVVSHNEYVKDMFDHTLMIELGNDGNSKAKWLVNETGKPTWDEEEVIKIISEFDSKEEQEEEEEEEQEEEQETI